MRKTYAQHAHCERTVEYLHVQSKLNSAAMSIAYLTSHLAAPAQRGFGGPLCRPRWWDWAP